MAFISFRMFIRISIYEIHFSLSVYKQYKDRASGSECHLVQIDPMGLGASGFGLNVKGSNSPNIFSKHILCPLIRPILEDRLTEEIIRGPFGIHRSQPF